MNNGMAFQFWIYHFSDDDVKNNEFSTHLSQSCAYSEVSIKRTVRLAVQGLEILDCTVHLIGSFWKFANLYV